MPSNRYSASITTDLPRGFKDIPTDAARSIVAPTLVVVEEAGVIRLDHSSR